MQYRPVEIWARLTPSLAAETELMEGSSSAAIKSLCSFMQTDPDALVTIATFETELEASFARGALQAVGISALVPTESQGTFSGLSRRPGLGRAELKVFETDRERALAELRRMRVKVVANTPSVKSTPKSHCFVGLPFRVDPTC